MIKFYYHPSPNPAKVALFLEESGLDFQLVPVDTQKGEQHSPGYLAINPNGKTPALTDGAAVVFDSNAILLYLSDKHRKFGAPDTEQARAQLLSWLMFVASGVGPFSGQAFHFKHMAPKPQTYAANRYDFEAERHWRIIDNQLARHQHMLDSGYSIADMSVWGWARAVPYVIGDHAWTAFPNVKRLLDEINMRPAAQRAEKLLTQHAFKSNYDRETLDALYPQNARLSASAV